MTTPVPGDQRERRDRIAARLAAIGAGLALAAGLVELIAGPSIREWVGGKQDTTRLGLTTTALAVIAALAAAAIWSPGGAPGARRIAVILGLMLPALVCFTTVGRLWYLPGLLLLASSAMLLSGTRRDEFAAAFTEEHWRVALLGTCGAYYVVLGATALGGAGALGILGGVLLWAVPAVARRSHRAAYTTLLAGALPFALVTWWSVVVPLIALLALWFGRTVIRQTDARARSDRLTGPPRTAAAG